MLPPTISLLTTCRWQRGRNGRRGSTARSRRRDCPRISGSSFWRACDIVSSWRRCWQEGVRRFRCAGAGDRAATRVAWEAAVVTLPDIGNRNWLERQAPEKQEGIERALKRVEGLGLRMQGVYAVVVRMGRTPVTAYVWGWGGRGQSPAEWRGRNLASRWPTAGPVLVFGSVHSPLPFRQQHLDGIPAGAICEIVMP